MIKIKSISTSQQVMERFNHLQTNVRTMLEILGSVHEFKAVSDVVETKKSSPYEGELLVEVHDYAKR